MAEALGLAASIVGLLGAAGKIIEIVGPIVSSIKDVARITAPIHTEVVNCRIILQALHGLLESLDNNGLTAKVQLRAALIQVDHLVSVLTEGVLLFSELESLVLSCGECYDASEPVAFQVRMKWARNEKGASDLLVRLQGFKSSTTVILNIFQCDSDIKAADDREALESMVSSLLDTNRNLAERMNRLESRIESESVLGQRLPHSLASVFGQGTDLTTIPELGLAPRSEFEAALEISKVYRRLQRDSLPVDRERPNSMAPSGRWSIFSSLSLSNISIVSILALPIYSRDLANKQHYQFDAPDITVSVPGGPATVNGPPDSQPVQSTTPSITYYPGLVWKGPASEIEKDLEHQTLEAMQNTYDSYIPGSGIFLQEGPTPPKLHRLTVRQLRELSIDVLDELSRRQMICLGAHSVPAFLRLNGMFHPKRNEARRKLATLPTYAMSSIVTDTYREMGWRSREAVWL